MRKNIVGLLGVLFLLLPVNSLATGLHDSWDELLKKHVMNGKVDYLGFKKDEDRLQKYLQILNSTDPNSLSRSDQLAYYINAYNSNTIQLILDNFKDGKPVSSIKKIGSFFSKPWSIRFVDLGGKTFTLDELEHEILRPRYKDPRIHFAINCASKSCPVLISEAYVADRLDQQLEKSTVNFLHDSELNYLKGNTLYLSKIFDWFSEDFDENPKDFIEKYAQGELKAKLEKADSDLKVKYLQYDWGLNSI